MVRFHPTRGAMSIGESDGGLPPDSLVEREAAILDDCIRVIDAFHDPNPGAMVRVGVAPCSPFSVSRELMRDAAVLARDKGVMMHTHLAENDEDIAYSLAQFGCRPGQYAEDLGWTGDDVWHAHCVKLDGREIDLFARSNTGVAHCPCSNCRLGSGIAPVRAMRDAGVPVGLGVDGSASNDIGNLMAEARQTMLLQRVANGADAMSAREALEIATRGGAQVLGRDDCGEGRQIVADTRMVSFGLNEAIVKQNYMAKKLAQLMRLQFARLINSLTRPARPKVWRHCGQMRNWTAWHCCTVRTCWRMDICRMKTETVCARKAVCGKRESPVAALVKTSQRAKSPWKK